MANKVFIGMSLDGYIATKDGGLDWLHETSDPTGDDFGFSEFMTGVDALVMGRATYEAVAGFEMEWPYAKKVFVLSNSLKSVKESLEDKVEIRSGEPKEIVDRLQKEGYKNLYIDGGNVIQNFLNAGMVDEMTLTRLPIILGSGIPLFSDNGSTLRLEHLDTQVNAVGFVKSKYKVLNL